MSQMCDYCEGEHHVTAMCYTILSHGFGHANKETRQFCSVECRTWWRRRCSDNPGAWEQPMQPGYQGRLDRYVADDANDTNADESAPQPTTITSSEPATVEAET
jgi:hypothetical protein